MLATSTIVGGIVLLSLLISGAFGHSYLTSPISRSDQTQSESGCRGPACLGPCDIPLASASRAPITIQRGANILAQWPRNNHAGGFIRFSWAPTSQSDTASAFDSGVSTIHCHEIGGCGPSDPSNPNGGDNGPADGSSGACQVEIIVPLSLSDGKYTLQWAWFGGAFALGDYYSCVDYTISGGPTGPVATPLYYGGDFSNPGENVCKFFNTDRLHQCVDEPCSNPIYPGSQQETGPAFGIQVAGSSAAPISTTASATTHNAEVVPATTGKASVLPATTGKASVLPATTHKAATTGKSISPSLTTGRVTIPTPSPSPSPSSGSNCAKVSVVSESQASIVSVDAWSTQFIISVSITVQENLLENWYLQVTWPSAESSTSIVNTYDAGSLVCQTPSYAIFDPVASWAQYVEAGDVLTIEILALNSNEMTSDYIMANTQVLVFSS